MFSNRFWLLKAALALGLFAYLSARAERELHELEPRVEFSIVDPQGTLGKRVIAGPTRVLEVVDEGFDIKTDGRPCRVVAPPGPRAGDVVIVSGTITGPMRIENAQVQPIPGYLWKRTATYVVSIAVLLVFLLIAGRRFRWDARKGILRGRPWTS